MADKKLDSKEQQELVERLAEVARSEMPLPEGLRAAASEAGAGRLATQLNHLAGRFAAGANWEDLLKPGTNTIPPHILGAIRAGIKSGHLADALDSLIDQQRAYRDTWRELFSTLAYPLLLAVCTVGLLLLALTLIVPSMEELFLDFGTELPKATQLWIDLSHDLPPVLLFGSLSLLVTLVAIRVVGGRSGWMQFIASLPIFGPMIHFAGVAQMLRLLQIMSSHEMPLPEALRLTASGVANANVQRIAQWLADGVEAGLPLSDLMASTPRIPASIVPVIRWGEDSSALGDAMQSAYELLEGQIRLRGSLLNVVAGPLMLIFVGVAIGSLTLSMFMPLVSLLQNIM